MKRGFRCRCPRCGEGRLFRAFLKADNNCAICGLDFTPHRADDLPAYLVIVIVGHLVVPMALMIGLYGAGGLAAFSVAHSLARSRVVTVGSRP